MFKILNFKLLCFYFADEVLLNKNKLNNFKIEIIPYIYFADNYKINENLCLQHKKQGKTT